MAKGYWIVHIDITDSDKYPQYLELDKLAFEKYDGTFLVRGAHCTGPEGPIRRRHIVIEFESYDKALECYHSAEYQKAVPLRHAFSNSDIVIVEGVY